MPDPVTHISKRFSNAALAERNRMEQRRSQLLRRRTKVQTDLDHLDKELETLHEQILMLEGLATSQDTEIRPSNPGEVADESAQLTGASIRATAVPLLRSDRGSSPIHYREWFELLVAQGFSVGGKRPDAVFLNQVVRSPLVRATSKSGFYVLDFDVPDELRQRLRRQQAEIVELAESLAGVSTDSEDFKEHRERRRKLSAAIARTERELEEALEALGDEDVDDDHMPEAREREAA